MNWVHIHLMTNHIPVIGTMIGIVILAYSLWKNSEEMKRFSLGFFVVLGAVTLLVYFTGEPAEEAIEKLPGVSEVMLERHEGASIFALVSLLVLSALSLAALVFRSLGLPERAWYWRTLVLVAVLSGGLMGWIANLGGKIRHTEIEARHALRVPDLWNQATERSNDRGQSRSRGLALSRRLYSEQ